MKHLFHALVQLIKNWRYYRNMDKPVKFKRLTPAQFNKKYPEALPCIDGNFVGEVKIPGHGWYACLTAGPKGDPTRFYDEDDGWNPVPKVKFEEVK